VIPVCSFPTGQKAKGAQDVEIVKRCARNINEFLASSAPVGEVKGVCPEFQH